jgi:hypothetical protein
MTLVNAGYHMLYRCQAIKMPQLQLWHQSHRGVHMISIAWELELSRTRVLKVIHNNQMDPHNVMQIAHISSQPSSSNIFCNYEACMVVIWYPAPSDGNTDLNNSPAHTMRNTFDLLLTKESQSGGLVHEFLFTQYIKGTHYASDTNIWNLLLLLQLALQP